MKKFNFSREKIETWVNKNRLRFPGYGTWLAGREPNTMEPEIYSGAGLRILIFRLSLYQFVSTSMTHGLLGQIASEIPGVYVDYGFMPGQAEASSMAVAKIPPVFGTASKRPFVDFDLVAFSISVSQELINLAWLIVNSGINLEYEKRAADQSIPILLMGGANAQSASISFRLDGGRVFSFVDALYFGEARPGFPQILEFLKQCKTSELSKKEILSQMAVKFNFVFVPGEQEQTERRRTFQKDLSKVKSLVKSPVWYDSDSIGYSNVAVDAGCRYLCSFCKEAWENRPYRKRPIEEILADIEEAKINQGLDSINLYSFNFTNHPDASSIINEAQKRIFRVLIKSQRFDLLAKHPEVLHSLQSALKTNFTFGLEGISQRLRNFLSKSLEIKDCFETLSMVIEGNIRQLKIFIILTGYENEQDWHEFNDFLEQIYKIRRKNPLSAKAPFVLSITPLISMPHSPMQFNKFPEKAALENGLKRMNSLSKNYGMVARESVSIDEARMVQLLLFSGGNQMQALLTAAGNDCSLLYYQKLSSRLVSNFEMNLTSEWIGWALREKSSEDNFPWDSSTDVAEKQRLYARYEDCKKFLDQTTPGKTETFAFKETGTRTAKAEKPLSLVHYWFSVDVSPELSGVPAKFFQTAAFRALALTEPQISKPYLFPGHQISMPEKIPVSGKFIFSLIFREQVDDLLARAFSNSRPQWGWSFLGWKKQPFSASPDGVTLEFTCPSDWMHKLQQVLSALSFKHRIVKNKQRTLLLISKPFVNKSGIYLACFDHTNTTATVSLVLGGNYMKVLTKSGLREKWENGSIHIRVNSLWKKDLSRRCGTCKAPLWADTFDGEIINNPSCPSGCKIGDSH